MSEFAETPREELEKKFAKKRPVVRKEQEDPKDTLAAGMEQLSHLVAIAIQNEAKLDPAFAQKLNEIAVQATVAAEKLVDYKQIWQNASFSEKIKLTPGMARAVVLMGACNALTQGIYAGVTEQALSQAKSDGSWTPEQVTSFSEAMREQGGMPDTPSPELTPSVSIPDLPQVQPSSTI